VFNLAKSNSDLLAVADLLEDLEKLRVGVAANPRL
jgi:hypothetical protein